MATRNPFSPAVREGLLRRMEADGVDTFAEKVRWVRKHMPNIDNASAFVGALVAGEPQRNPQPMRQSWEDAFKARRNPPDAGYTAMLGSGAFTQAYAKPDTLSDYYTFDERDEDGFATGKSSVVARGRDAVQTVTKKQITAGRDGWGDPESVDASKVIMLLARDALKADKKAQAYLPDLTFVRFDRTNPKQPELVFSMPAYKLATDVPARERPEVSREIARCLDVFQTHQGTLEEAAQKFMACVSRKGIPAVTREAPNAAKALMAMHLIAKGLPLTKYRADLHDGNVAIDTDGHIILLDPIVAEMKFSEVEKLLGQAQAKQGKKNPPQPELFKGTTKATVSKQTLKDRPAYADEAVSLIQTAYAPIGGHANMRTRDDLLADDADVYRFEDIDSDLEPDVLQVSKTTPYGLKTVAMGHDGTKEAKRKAVEDKIEDFRSFGNYGEVSGALAKRVLSAGVPVVGDQRIVEKVLNKKVEWIGTDPDFPGVYGWYERMLGGHKHRKILVGLPEQPARNPSKAEAQLSPTQQRKYLGSLKGKERAARASEIVERRKPQNRSNEPFQTDEGKTTRRSSHAKAFEAAFGRAPSDVADAAKLTGIPKKVLEEVYARGMAAWQTGHRPGASQHAWAMARVESFATGGPTSKTADADLAAKVQNPAGQEDYRGQHRAPDADTGAPLHDLSQVYDDEVYGRHAVQYYGTGERYDAPAFAVVKAARNRPDAQVTIYRAVPKTVTGGINPGDWVAIVRQYAVDHGEGALQGDYRILTKVVPAKTLYTNGDSIHEWGYSPEQQENPAGQTFIPPPDVAEAARQGLELRAKQPASNRCCTSVGLRRAAQLANRQPVSVDTLRRMKAYFARHYGPDSRGKGWGKDSKGWQAHLCWGGDPGMRWADKLLRSL